MSLASLAGLNPRNPLVVANTETLAIGSAFAPQSVTFPVSASATAPYQLTTAGLTSFNVAEWNALTTANFKITGINNGGVAVVYELVSFTGGSVSTGNTLTFKMTPLVALAGTQATNMYISIITPTLV